MKNGGIVATVYNKKLQITKAVGRPLSLMIMISQLKSEEIDLGIALSIKAMKALVRLG